MDTEYGKTREEILTLGNGEMANQWDMVSSHGVMEISTKVSGI